ncbi:Ultraviolet-B receptor UVR8, partial [Linum perenne]
KKKKIPINFYEGKKCRVGRRCVVESRGSGAKNYDEIIGGIGIRIISSYSTYNSTLILLYLNFIPISVMANSKLALSLLPRLRLTGTRWMSSFSSPGSRFAALWGNGDYGRLGLGNLDSQSTPKPLLSSSFRNQALKSISCGGAHTLFLTESGQVFATGLNDFGQLGISGNDISYVDGELYVWGRNSNGQLGLGKKAGKSVCLPTKVDLLSGIKIKMVALASEHSVAITDEGDALSWGGGDSGKLGHSCESGILGLLKSKSEYVPRRIKKLEGVKVKRIAAGLLHTACIDENGSVFIFGERAVNKLRFGEKKNATIPSMVDVLPSSSEVACGGYHTCVVTGAGELYAWGSNENGCLGFGTTDAFGVPERIEGPFVKSSVDKVSCGWKHTAAISEDKVFTWGWGGSHGTFSEDGHSSGGQLGHGSDVDYRNPMVVNFGEKVRAVQVSCGFNHTGALLEG